jgi:hypothetical protein
VLEQFYPHPLLPVFMSTFCLRPTYFPSPPLIYGAALRPGIRSVIFFPHYSSLQLFIDMFSFFTYFCNFCLQATTFALTVQQRILQESENLLFVTTFRLFQHRAHANSHSKDSFSEKYRSRLKSHFRRPHVDGRTGLHAAFECEHVEPFRVSSDYEAHLPSRPSVLHESSDGQTADSAAEAPRSRQWLRAVSDAQHGRSEGAAAATEAPRA